MSQLAAGQRIKLDERRDSVVSCRSARTHVLVPAGVTKGDLVAKGLEGLALVAGSCLADVCGCSGGGSGRLRFRLGLLLGLGI